MRILVVGYWVWFGISIIVLSRRLIVRVTQGGKSERARRAAGTTGEVHGTDAPPAALDDLASRVAARLAAAAPGEAPDTVAAPAGPPAPPRTATATTASPATAPPAADALAGTVFAPRLPAPTRSDVAGARTTIAEVLRGIAMPSGLAPLVHMAGTDPARRVVFCTTGHPVEIVGAQLAEELSRLGFALEPIGATDAIARRGDDAVALRMRTIGPQPEKGPADVAYPTAPAGSVVLDVELA